MNRNEVALAVLLELVKKEAWPIKHDVKIAFDIADEFVDTVAQREKDESFKRMSNLKGVVIANAITRANTSHSLLNALKYIKEELDCSLKTAKEICDEFVKPHFNPKNDESVSDKRP